MSVKGLLTLLLALLLNGCAVLKGETCPYLAPGVGYCLLSPAGTLSQRQIEKIVIEVPGTPKMTLQGVRESTPGSMVLAATGAAGQISLSLKWDGRHLESRNHGLPDTLDPAWLLAMVQLSEYPLAGVEAALSGAGLTETTTGDLRQRQLWQDSERLMTLSHSNNYTRVEHHNYGLTMTINTLSREAL
ncbi:DUF3261 domain-containing protein [Ferrimonas futtsuensis]|uniref:DUF3261 domain-containing protein n=1 Tax=Ferrimonas futtsuensis TaxID=364764 RepID=UPI000424F62C|nr:DUF3261 domain-containing protein [Ferrimonas futtsuensis]